MAKNNIGPFCWPIHSGSESWSGLAQPFWGLGIFLVLLWVQHGEPQTVPTFLRTSHWALGSLRKQLPTCLGESLPRTLGRMAIQASQPLVSHSFQEVVQRSEGNPFCTKKRREKTTPRLSHRSCGKDLVLGIFVGHSTRTDRGQTSSSPLF